MAKNITGERIPLSELSSKINIYFYVTLDLFNIISDNF